MLQGMSSTCKLAEHLTLVIESPPRVTLEEMSVVIRRLHGERVKSNQYVFCARQRFAQSMRSTSTQYQATPVQSLHPAPVRHGTSDAAQSGNLNNLFVPAQQHTHRGRGRFVCATRPSSYLAEPLGLLVRRSRGASTSRHALVAAAHSLGICQTIGMLDPTCTSSTRPSTRCRPRFRRCSSGGGSCRSP
jgi:hypothetical protein